jgi:hypothetical protein
VNGGPRGATSRHVAAIFAISAAASALAQPGLHTVSGTVASGGKPVAGAEVIVSPIGAGAPIITATTDASGRFSGKAPAGGVNAGASLPGRADLISDGVFFPLSQDTEIRFELEPAVNVSLRVVSPGTAAGRIDVYRLSGRRIVAGRETQDGRVDLALAPDIYSITAVSTDARLAPARVNVDLRDRIARTITLHVGGREGALVPAANAPNAQLVRIETAGEDGMAAVRGLPGCAEPLNALLVMNLHTGQVAYAVSEPDGSFATRMFAPPGATLLIKSDPIGRFVIDGIATGFTGGPPATILTVPQPQPQRGGVAFATGGFLDHGAAVGGWPAVGFIYHRGRLGAPDAGQWWMSGEIEGDGVQPGGALRGRGTLVIHSRNLTGAGAESVQIGMSYFVLEKVIDEHGLQQSMSTHFASSVTTPTGFPIAADGWGRSIAPAVKGQPVVKLGPLRKTAPNRMEADWTLEGVVPSFVRPGLYRLFAGATATGIDSKPLHFEALPMLPSSYLHGALPLIRVGEPRRPRLFWALLLDELSDGSRGIVAEEDRGRFGVSTNVIYNKRDFVLPMHDSRSGRTIRYSLEPYVPMLGGVPQIPIALPSGSFSVQIVRPDGSVQDLGSAPFRQWQMRTPLTPRGVPTSNFTAHPADYYQLVTGDPRFTVEFTTYGLHRIIAKGTVQDSFGNTYEGGGEYRLYVARLLDLETGILPGTPFETGGVLAPSVTVKPPVPADVAIEAQLLPNSDPAKAIRASSSGRANRFGHFQAAPLMTASRPGEYRIDVRASYTDEQGVLWMNSASWGSIVETPDSPLITRGRRGYDQQTTIGDQWYVFSGHLGHVRYPFHSGDVMWFDDGDPPFFAAMPKITIHDPIGDFAARMRSRASHAIMDRPDLESRITAGEIPLVSSVSGSTAAGPPDEADERGYAYAVAERPGVRAREVITEDANGSTYWRFSDGYFGQLGVGSNGDLPNDFKFQFAGSVYRAPGTGFFHYGSYASFFVIIPGDDPLRGRIFPPFQGNGGGPDGGPLLRLKRKEIDIFLHPTSVQPGTILQRGDRVAFSGYSAPTLPSKIEIAVTSPSGQMRAIRGQASKIGYFHDPSQDFIALEPGPWKAKVNILFDGLTSAGQVTPPYPSGDVLGARDGEFRFYVVDPDTPPLDVSTTAGAAPCGICPRLVRPADGPIVFTVAIPAGLTDVEMHVTTTMPGFILEETRTTAAGQQRTLSYRYDARTLARDFPNIDLTDADGMTGVDTIAISFLVSGSDSAGARQHYARQIVIAGEELQMPPQKALTRKRRAVR